MFYRIGSWPPFTRSSTKESAKNVFESWLVFIIICCKWPIYFDTPFKDCTAMNSELDLHLFITFTCEHVRESANQCVCVCVCVCVCERDKRRVRERGREIKIERKRLSVEVMRYSGNRVFGMSLWLVVASPEHTVTRLKQQIYKLEYLKSIYFIEVQ